MSLVEKFSSGFRWVAAARLAAQLISWGGTVLVMRLLAPNDYGIAAVCSYVLAVVAAMAEFGFGAALIQAKTLQREQIRSVLGAAILFSLFSAAAMFALSPLLGWFFRAPEVTPLIQASVFYLLVMPWVMLPDAFLKRDMRFRGASVIELAAGLTATLATLTMAWNGAGVWSLVLGPIIGFGVRAVLLNVVFPYSVWPSLRIGHARELIVFGARVSLARLASNVHADTLIGGRMLSKAAFGEYAVAVNLAILPLGKMMFVVNQVAYPAIAHLTREGGDTHASLLVGLRLFAYALFPMLWGIAAVAPSLVRVVVGPTWEGAILPLQIVCIASPLRLVSSLMSTAVLGIGRPDIDLKNTITGVIVMSLCFLVGAFFGAVGLAMAWLVGLPLLIILNLQRAKTVLGLTVASVLAAVAPPTACSALMVICVYGLKQFLLGPADDSLIDLIAMVLCGVVVYAGVMWYAARSSAMALLRVVFPRR